MSESYYSFSPYNYAGNNPIRYVDVNGEWWGEDSHVGNAKKHAKKTGGKFEKWTGQNGKTWASVRYSLSGKSGETGVHSRIYKGTKENDNTMVGNFFRNLDNTMQGHSDPCNTGTITKEDAQVGGAIIGTIVTGGALIEAEGAVALTIGIISTLNSVDGITTNEDGSIVTGMIDNKSTKEKVKGAKRIISVAAMGASGSEVPAKIQSIIPFANDAFSNIQYTVEKIQEVDEKK